jgi:hypothetical protein
MYTITDIDFDPWCRIIFENLKGKEFEIICSNTFGEKFYKRYVILPNNHNADENYIVRVSFIDSRQKNYFTKRFSLIRLYWLKFRGYLSLAIEEMFT